MMYVILAFIITILVLVISNIIMYVIMDNSIKNNKILSNKIKSMQSEIEKANKVMSVISEGRNEEVNIINDNDIDINKLYNK